MKTLYVRQEVDQFIKEANSMATLHHKHIIQLFGVVLAQPLMLVRTPVCQGRDMGSANAYFWSDSA